MNPIEWHLLLNHLPIIVTLVGVVLLIYSLVVRNKSIIKASLSIFIFTALITIPVFLTGEDAEHEVKGLAGIRSDSIEEHEEFAAQALWGMELLGIISLVTLILLKKAGKRFSRPFILVSLFLSLLVAALMIRTGHFGGMIRHSEMIENKPLPTDDTYKSAMQKQ